MDLPVDIQRYERQASWRDFATPLNLLGIEDGWRILDVGCGSGTVSRQIADQRRTGAIIGLDYDSSHVAAAHRLTAGRGTRRVYFAVGDARYLPFAEGAFDLVWTSFLLQYLAADPVSPVREFARVVRPGGIVAAFDVHGFMLHHEPIESDLADRLHRWYQSLTARGFDPNIGERLPEVFETAGLSDVRSRQFPDPELYPLGRPPETILEGWEQRLTGMRGLADALGSEEEAERFRRDFLSLLRRPERRTIGANWLVWGRVP